MTFLQHPSSLQLCLILSLLSPWQVSSVGGVGVGILSQGRAVGDTVSSTRASAVPVLVGSSGHTQRSLSGSLGPSPSRPGSLAHSPRRGRTGTWACWELCWPP